MTHVSLASIIDARICRHGKFNGIGMFKAFLERWQKAKSGRIGAWLGSAESSTLVAMAEGWSLRSHRNIEGEKVYKLHSLNDEQVIVQPKSVQLLRTKGLIETNQKFPTATYLLTGVGQIMVQELIGDGDQIRPISARNFTQK